MSTVVDKASPDLALVELRRRAALTRNLADRLPYPPPFDALWSYRRRQPTPLNLMRAMRAAIVWSPERRRRKRQLLAYFNWLGQFPIDVIRFGWRYGRAARDHLARSYVGQIADMIRLGVSSGLPPRVYYEAGAARDRGRDLVRYQPYSLYASVAIGLSLARNAGSLQLEADKFVFETRCRALGLPVVRTLAIVGRTGVRNPDGTAYVSGLAGQDLLLKPATGSKGRGVEAWRWNEGGFVGEGGKRLTEAGLIQRAGTWPARNGIDILIQKRERNHPSLAALPEALATCRVVTMINERDEPELVLAYLRTPSLSDVPVDNFDAGGLTFPIDWATGRMAPGYHRSFEAKPVTIEINPVSGVPLAGTVHPGWPEIRDLALRAHRAFKDLLIVGWDIGYTQAGAIIVEFNVPPGMDGTDQHHLGGVTRTRIFALLGYHAEKWLKTNLPEGSRWRPR